MDTSYKKRSGTSGISGQLYETKLISLLLFRLLHDNDVEDFHLASNMDEVGAFDDICVKVKIKGQKPVILFIQVKHKDNDDKFVVFNNNSDLVKWSDSILKIKQKFGSARSCSIMFGNGVTECLFILYTNAKYVADLSDPFQSDVAINVNRLLATKETVGSRLLCNEKFVQNLSNRIFKEEISILTERLIKYLCGKANQSMNILNDEYILRYHVILTMKVFEVSEIQYDEANPEIKWRQLTFRSDFFSTNDKHLLLIKAYLFEKSFNYAKTKRKATIDENTSQDLSTPETMMAELMWPFFNDFSLNNKNELSKQLSEVNIEQDWQSLLTIDKRKEIVATTILSSLKIKVPIAFGNLDLSVRGNAKKIESRINHLTNIIIDLCQKSRQENVIKFITIVDTTDEGLLSPNGGLGGIIGNVLINDEETKSYKFTNTDTSLKNNAKTLYLKLQKKLINLQEFRFKVEAFKLPRLSFDYTETAKDFLSNIIVYANQGNHYEIEEILKKEIDTYNNDNCYNVSVHTDSAFLYYHNEIQKWWMTQKTGMYLTKSCDIYRHSMNNIVIEPHMSALHNTFHLNKIKNNSYTFTENTMHSLHSLQNISMRVIVTDITTLTTMKVIQYLRNKNTREYAILDLQCILNVNLEHFTAFTTELKNTQKISIIVCDYIQDNKNLHRRLNCILGALQEKHTIIIVHNTFVEVIKEYCPPDDNHIHESHNLANLTPDSQMHIIKNVQIIFQGQNTRLDLFLNDEFINYINGTVLDKIIRNETLIIGETLSNSSYEDIKHFYIERSVNLTSDNAYNIQNDLEYEVISFFDLADDTVLLTAKPGMGKSTLLTHLSLETKKLDPTLWIVRINLLDHSKDFFKWQENGIAFNRLEILKFLCKTVLRKNNLQVTLREENDMVYLDSCTAEEWTMFELKLFLHLYNQRKVILLFDGFDEICPHYKDCVVQFLIMTKDLPQRNKMWVTSRPYSEILPGLKKVLGKCYEIGYLDDFEQEKYLKKIWNVKLAFNDLNEFQMKNALTLMIFIRDTKKRTDALSYKFSRIIRMFYNYLYLHFSLTKTATKFQMLPNSNYFYTLLNSTTGGNSEESQLQHQNSDTDTLLGTPLLLHLIAHYFVDVIRVSEKFDERICINIHRIYTMFVEMKLKIVLFQDKNKMDIYNPSIMKKYEQERKECWDMHKKIAAYVLLGSPIFSGLNFSELKDMNPLNEGGLTKFNAIINSIKSGTEKTGLISHVTADNIPVFIHRTFAEYFAAEFICDIFKSETFEFEDKRVLFTATSICHSNDVLPWIMKKRELDKELYKILWEIQDSLPVLWLWHYGGFKQLLAGGNWSLEQNIRLMILTPKDFKNDSFILNCEYRHYLYIQNHTKKRKKIIGNIKPHLKKYFVTAANERQPKSLRFNLKSTCTRLKKHLLKRKSLKFK